MKNLLHTKYCAKFLGHTTHVSNATGFDQINLLATVSEELQRYSLPKSCR